MNTEVKVGDYVSVSDADSLVGRHAYGGGIAGKVTEVLPEGIVFQPHHTEGIDEPLRAIEFQFTVVPHLADALAMSWDSYQDSKQEIFSKEVAKLTPEQKDLYVQGWDRQSELDHEYNHEAGLAAAMGREFHAEHLA